MEANKWESMFELLLEYKDQHGNTLVPQSYDRNPKLGTWVSHQRQMHSRKMLTSTRVSCLESIGFTFSLQKSIADAVKWESMFELLLKYKDEHGNTMVPQSYDRNPQLGTWVKKKVVKRSCLASGIHWICMVCESDIDCLHLAINV